MTFYERIVKETAEDKERFFQRKTLSNVIVEGAPKELYLLYLEQAYHHVRFTCPLLEQAKKLLNQNNDKKFAEAFQEYIVEETGHEEWILNDLSYIGGDKEKVRNSTGDLPVQSMIAYMKFTIDNIGPYALLGMVYVLEGTSVNIATAVAKKIADNLKINTKKGFSYLLSHGELDISHVDFFINLVNQIKDKQIQDQIIETAKMIYFLWGSMFDEIEYKLNNPTKKVVC